MGVDLKLGVAHSKVTLVPQKMLNKTCNSKIASCKAASRGCNQYH